jgi:hypothetical protein
MPFANMLIADKRIGTRDHGGSRPFSSVDEALSAIRSLDGKTRTQVVLEGPDRALMIGGGNEGRFNVVLAVDVDREFFNLLNSGGSSTKEVVIVSGGQAGSFPENLCVDLTTTLKAAEEFFNTGEPSKELAWEHV